MHYSTKSTSLNQARATLNQVLITFPLLTPPTTVWGAKTRCVCEPDQTLFSATTNKNGKKRSGHARLAETVTYIMSLSPCSLAIAIVIYSKYCKNPELKNLNNFSASAIGRVPQREIHAITINRTIKITTK